MFVLALFSLAPLLGGCRLDVGVDIEVEADASGTLALSIMTDSELDDAAESAGVDPLGRMVERIEAADTPWGVEASVDEVTGDRVVTVEADFADPAEFQVRYEELRAALDAPEARLLGPLTLSVDPETDVMSLVGALPLEVTDVAAADLGTDVASLHSQLSGVVSSVLTLRTPGPVVDAMGVAAVSGEEIGTVPVAGPFPDEPLTLTWVTDQPGDSTSVSATFEPGGLDLALLAVVGALGVVVVGALGTTLALRRRR